MSKTEIICKTILTSISILVIGEGLASAISRPIAALRRKRNIDADKLSTLLDAFNERICNLEDVLKEEA